MIERFVRLGNLGDFKKDGKLGEERKARLGGPDRTHGYFKGREIPQSQSENFTIKNYDISFCSENLRSAENMIF